MTPELLFAKALSDASEKHLSKVASGLNALSIEELEQILSDEPSEEKVAEATSDTFEQLCEMADQWGRELARKEYEKVAGIIPPAISQGAQKMVGGALNMATQTPVAKRMAVGAGIGAVGGAMHNPGLDQQTGQQRSVLPGMMMGGALGAMAGHAVGPAANHVMGQPGAIGQYAQQAAAAARIPKPMAPAMAGVAASPVTAPAQPPMPMGGGMPGQQMQLPMGGQAPAQGAQQGAQAAKPAPKPAAKASGKDGGKKVELDQKKVQDRAKKHEPKDSKNASKPKKKE